MSPTEKPFDAGLQGDDPAHWKGIPFDTENDLLRDRSGRVTDRRPLVGLLYDLLRDEVPPARIERLVREQGGGDQFVFSNGWLAQYAQDLANRLLGVDDIEAAFIESCRSLKRVPTFEGWRKGEDVHIHLRISMEHMGDMLLFKVTGSCCRQASDAGFDIGVITLEKTDQELYACGDLSKFFESYVVDQAFALAEAKWIESETADA